MTNDPIEALGVKLKKEFVRQARLHSRKGKAWQLSTRDKGSAVWYVPALLCQSLGADPLDFVTACFEGCCNKRLLFVNSLGSKKAELWYKNYMHKKETQVADKQTPTD